MSRARTARVPGRRVVIGAAGAVAVAGLLVAVLAHHREQFVTALRLAPLGILLAAAGLQLVALVARTGAWWVCVGAAGGTVGRRPLFRAASMGYLGSQLNGQLGAAARIAALRRSAPHSAPLLPALIAAELPILLVEGALAAVASATLVGPLGLPWWVPVVCLAGAVCVGATLQVLCRRRDNGFWKGLAVLRSARGGARTVALVLLAVFAQIARNWLMLHAVGVHTTVLDATAVLIAMVTLSQLPVGPSVGAAAAVLILGSHGAAAAAAAGVLLTATGTAGALTYVAWAGIDRVWVAQRRPGRGAGSGQSRRTRVPIADAVTARALSAARARRSARKAGRFQTVGGRRAPDAADNALATRGAGNA